MSERLEVGETSVECVTGEPGSRLISAPGNLDIVAVFLIDVVKTS